MIKVSRQRLSSQVYSILKEMITNYRFRPGMRLNIEELARQMGASHTPVWEAVHRLIQEGLLKNIPHRGVFIPELTPETAIELYTVRAALEGLAARLAVGRTNSEAIRDISAILKQQLALIQKRDLIGYSKLSFDFHTRVHELCGNRTLQEMLESLKDKMRTIAVDIEPILPRLYQDHFEILNAFKAKDPERAEAAFRAHNFSMIRQIESATKNVASKQAEKSYVPPDLQAGLSRRTIDNV